MNRESIAKALDVEKLENYIIDEFLIGKIEGDIHAEAIFKESIIDMDEIKSDDLKISHIFSELIKIKNEFSFPKNNYFNNIIQEAKEYAENLSLDALNEQDELNNLAKFILDYFDFKKTKNFIVQGHLLKIRDSSRRYHLMLNYILKSKTHFDFLNDKCKIDRYTWEWINFESGLTKVLGNHAFEKFSLKSNFNLQIENLDDKNKREIKFIKLRKNREIAELKNEVKDLNKEIDRLNKEIEIRINFHNKYYYDTQIMVSDTYVGDNLPFLFNLYNFLKTNNLFSYGWSYFYTCMIIGNTEMIPLKSSKKQNFIGRILFHFKDYLTLHYKDESFKFLKSKFLINDVPLTENFRTNHMKTKYDSIDDPELIAIDDFFTKQKKIYLKK